MIDEHYNYKEMILSSHIKGNIVEKKRGSYGVVYIVKRNGIQNAIPKYVACKTTKDEYSSEKLNAFIRETKVWLKVRGYALILTPFYIINIKNRPLICMPYCEKTLRDYLNEHEKLSPIEALVIICQIIKGLLFAKNRGIEAHQDLKPENILLEDISKKFEDWLSKDVNQLLKWRVRICDFGSANAWRELGKPYGTKPYMAPEQWKMKSELEKKGFVEEKIDFSKVDVFAVGVILYELIMGKHPIGVRTSDVWPEPKEGFPKRYKKDEKWNKWSKKSTDIKLYDNLDGKEELENLIKSMLFPDPKKRLSHELAFERIMNILTKLHAPTAERIRLLFEYYDSWAINAYERYNRLDSLIELSKIPVLREKIADQLLEEIKGMEGNVSSASDAVYFCELCHKTAYLLLKHNITKNREKIKKLAQKMLKTAIKWMYKIKICHKYPEVKFRNITLVKTPYFRDFEVYAEIIGYVRKLLEEVEGKKETQKIFSKADNYTRSAYFYSIASEYHTLGYDMKAVKILEKCIDMNPNELFYYMKALWTKHYLFKMNTLGKLNENTKQQLKKSIIKNTKKAVELAPEWEEPREFLRKFKEKFT